MMSMLGAAGIGSFALKFVLGVSGWRAVLPSFSLCFSLTLSCTSHPSECRG